MKEVFIKLHLYSLVSLAVITMSSVSMANAQTISRPIARDRIHLGDVIDVDVIGSFEFDWRGSLTPEGFLDNFDKVDDQIFALCKTEDELAATIREKYSRILRDPLINVKIIDKTGRPYALVTGAVFKPQRYAVNRDVRLSELIIRSGGITDNSGGEIHIFRPPGASCDPADSVSFDETENKVAPVKPSNSPQNINIKISDLISGDVSANPLIKSGDIVTVTRAYPIYITGGVNNPAVLTYREGLSLSRSIAMAGGVSKGATVSDVTLFRKETDGVITRKFDLAEIIAGRSEDIELKPYDVIEVGQKGREPRTHPPVVENYSPNDENSAKFPLFIIN